MLKKITVLLTLAFMLAPQTLRAETGYDRYASLYTEREERSLFSKVASDFLTYPFELVRWPVNKGLVFAEDQHLLTKGEYLYNKVVDQGITPYLGFSRIGAEIDFVRLTRQKVNYPDFTLKGWVDYYEGNFSTGGKVGLERILETPLRTFTSIQYDNRPEEHFHGIGPDTSRGEGVSFKRKQTAVETTLGYSKDPSFSADLKMNYRATDIEDGDDDHRGQIDETFPNNGDNIPGRDGDDIVGMGIDLVRDTRDHKDASTRGYFGHFGYTFNEGVKGSDSRYLKLISEFSHYQQIFSNRRIFVSHFYYEDNNALPNHEVPFFDMAQLGGYGNYPSNSRTLRGYDEGRFFDRDSILFNFEYRYTVYEYNDWKADTVLFSDMGQTFRKWSEFQGKDFNASFGGGIRLSVLGHVLLSLEVAHGDEGTWYYAKNRAPF